MKSKILSAIDLGAVKELAKGLLLAGLDEEAIVTEIAAVLDEALDFRKIVGGIAGAALENIDGAVFLLVARAIAKLVLHGAKS